MHEHIAKIIARKYAFKNERGQFLPTQLGRALVEGFNELGFQLAKPALRAKVCARCQI
jgi:DNA topoisomerase III